MTVASFEAATVRRYAQAREALWGKPRQVNVRAHLDRVAEPKRIAPPPLPPAPKAKPKVKFIWVRQYNDHVIAFRRWQLAEEQGKEYVPLTERPDVNAIIMEVLSGFPGVTIDDIKGPRRTKLFARPRQLAIYEVSRQRPDMSFPQIGRLFGGRDHTTCLHAVKKIEAERGAIRGRVAAERSAAPNGGRAENEQSGQTAQATAATAGRTAQTPRRALSIGG